MGCTSSGCAPATVLKNGEGGPKPEPLERFQAVTPVQEPRVPSFHDEYIVLGKLGSGAFASVYLAHKVADKDLVAVKVMDFRSQRQGGSWNAADNRRKQASHKEMELLKMVSGQQHVLKMYASYLDVQLEGCLSYIVIEKCDATLLQVMERESHLNERTLRRVFREMLLGLAAVHAVGVAHRDVKPDNFLCKGPEGSVRLCDFGLACTFEPQGSNLMGIFGTPPFMAPEMLAAQGYNAKVDAWSMGVIMYCLFLGQFPYKPVEATGPAMKAAILAGTPLPTFRPKPALDSGAGGTSPEGVSLLKDLLQRAPDNRPSCAEALDRPWFHKRADEEINLVSLRPMLYSAKRIGCFDVQSSRTKATELDARLTELQEIRRGPLPCSVAVRPNFDQVSGSKGASSSSAKDLARLREDKSPQTAPGSTRARKVSPSDTSTTDTPSDSVATSHSAA